MKKIITFGMALVMLLLSLSGCFVAVEDRDRERHDRGERHERGEGHDRGDWHEERH
ncbi:MAG TPA: hypothetical protein VMT12_12060 [Syntrophales bacterium]|nr:hypothetical protein [Syntrophales bacterium]